jgi:hypothetical protein
MLISDELKEPPSVRRVDVPTGITRDKQLAGVDLCVALFKWSHQIACNLKEVAIVTGHHYAQVRRWRLQLFDGKITRSEFIAWKRETTAKRHSDQTPREAMSCLQSIGPATAARQRRFAAANSVNSTPSPTHSGIPVSAELRENRTKAENRNPEPNPASLPLTLRIAEAVCPT